MKPRSEAARTTVRHGHHRTNTIVLHTLDDPPVPVPITEGWVGADLSSRAGARTGQLTIPGYQWKDRFDLERVPWVTVSHTIGEETWHYGEYPAVKVSDQWPGGLVTVELGDWAGRRSRSKAEFPHDMDHGATLAEFIEYHMSHVMPGGVFSVTRDDTGSAAKPFHPRITAGGDVWRAMVDVAAAADAYLQIDTMTSGAIRRYDPHRPPDEDLTGTVHRASTGQDLDNVVNRVVARTRGEGADGGQHTARRDIDPAASGWGFDRDGVGYCILVDGDTVPVSSQAIADDVADYLYDRRAGAVESREIRTIPQPWLEVGDVIHADLAGRGPVDGVIDRIEHPLRSDRPQIIRLRGVPAL